MTQDQENIRTMFQTTIAVLDNNNAVWSGRAAFADAVTRARDGIEQIDTAADKQEVPTTGMTGDKAQARADLEQRTLEIADQLAALAVKNSDNDLAAKVQMTKSYLDQLSGSDLEQTAERVAGLANDSLADLAPFGMTAAEVTALDNARTTFTNIKIVPRTVAAERKAQTQSLAQLIQNVRSIFRNELDKMMTPFRRINADFYNGDFAARSIVSRSATHAFAAPAGGTVAADTSDDDDGIGTRHIICRVGRARRARTSGQVSERRHRGAVKLAFASVVNLYRVVRFIAKRHDAVCFELTR